MPSRPRRISPAGLYEATEEYPRRWRITSVAGPERQQDALYVMARRMAMLMQRSPAFGTFMGQ